MSPFSQALSIATSEIVVAQALLQMSSSVTGGPATLGASLGPLLPLYNSIRCLEPLSLELRDQFSEMLTEPGIAGSEMRAWEVCLLQERGAAGSAPCAERVPGGPWGVARHGHPAGVRRPSPHHHCAGGALCADSQNSHVQVSPLQVSMRLPLNGTFRRGGHRPEDSHC